MGDPFIVRLQGKHGLQGTVPENWLLPGEETRVPLASVCAAFVFARALPLPTASLPHVLLSSGTRTEETPEKGTFVPRLLPDKEGRGRGHLGPRGEGSGIEPQRRVAQTGRRQETGFSVRSLCGRALASPVWPPSPLLTARCHHGSLQTFLAVPNSPPFGVKPGARPQAVTSRCPACSLRTQWRTAQDPLCPQGAHDPPGLP